MEAAGVEPAVSETADLQSTGVTNFPTHPKFVPDYTALEHRVPILTSVRWQLFPLTTLFLPLLDRLCLSFVNNTAGGTRNVSPVIRIIEAREVSPGSVSVYSYY